MRTKGEGAEAAKNAVNSYRQQAAMLEAERSAVTNDGDVVRMQLDEALQELAHELLPDASDATLTRVDGLLGGGTLSTRRAQYQQQRAGWAERLAQIEADPSFVNRETMLHPEHGSLARDRAQCEKYIASVQQHLARFQIEPFTWLQNRELEQEMNKGAFSGFMRAVTFANARENKARQKCCEQLGFETWEALQQDYRDSELRMAQTRTRVEQLDHQRVRLNALLEEHGNTYMWVHSFEEQLTSVLRRELAAELGKADLRGLSMKLMGNPAGPKVAKAHGLQSKLGYLGNIAGFLGREKADREKRAAGIQKVIPLWAAKPYERLTGDKSKWLIELPLMKQKSTKKRVGWTRSMHRNVYDYDDWDDYALYLTTVDHFLPYDAFSYAGDEKPPYEGFSRDVLPELAEHREETGLEKADYSTLREVAREQAEEGGRDFEDGHATDEDAAAAEAAAAAVVAAEMLDGADAS